MMLKYSFEVLSWQQFEILSFKVLQKEISKSIQFIEGGSDKGRDILYSGVTSYFEESSQPLDYLFQVKHKTGQRPYSDLKVDLTKELEKVFIINNLAFHCYCLVTNITISGDQFDELNRQVSIFRSEHGKGPISFYIFSYRHFESVLDSHPSIKWDFPMVVPRADFQFILTEIVDRSASNLIKGWTGVFEKNRERFVYTEIYEIAKNKISNENILLISGPPRSGKTFTAEMIALSLFFTDAYTPIRIDNIDDFDRLYAREAKQLFLFDDVFGRHNLDAYRADYFDRKLDYIFELIDDGHKCLFTSREYIVRAFSEYSDKELAKFIDRIIVETSNLSLPEKESLLRKYYSLKFVDQFPFDDMLLRDVIEHQNFSPESIRSYFEDCATFRLNEFLAHLASPDKYLEKLFFNLTEDKKIVLLSILFSLHGEIKTISYAFENVSSDLNKSYLLNLTTELRLLEGSIIKGGSDERYSFYHPSMTEFFVNFLGADSAVYKKVLLRNLNVDLISILTFQKDPKSKKQIYVDIPDALNLTVGFERIFQNPFATLSEINSVLSWLQTPNIQLNFKVKANAEYKRFKEAIKKSFEQVDLNRYLVDDPYSLAFLFKVTKHEFSTDTVDTAFVQNILRKRKGDASYWLLVFRLLPFMTDELIFKTSIVGRDWLNNFFLQLRNEINLLGSELYGSAYPDFPEVAKYNFFIAEKNFDEAAKLKFRRKSDHKQDTSRSWFPRYRAVKEKMNVLKTCHPHGYLIYERLLPLFQHLVILEDNQRNRYLFNKAKRWW